jgi:hypothetical protein
VKYAFIEQHRDQYPIRTQCRVLQVSHSGFYDWQRRGLSLRDRENQQLVLHLKRVHAQSRENYGLLKACKYYSRKGFAAAAIG